MLSASLFLFGSCGSRLPRRDGVSNKLGEAMINELDLVALSQELIFLARWRDDVRTADAILPRRLHSLFGALTAEMAPPLSVLFWIFVIVVAAAGPGGFADETR